MGEYKGKITEKDIQDAIDAINYSNENDDTDIQFYAVCKERGPIIYDSSTSLCDNPECYWCNSIRKQLKQ